MTGTESQIEQLLDDYAGAMRKCDAEAVVAHYAPGIVQFTLAPPLQQDPAEVVEPAGLKAWFDGHGGGPMGYDITARSVTTDGDVAFVSSVNRMGTAGTGFDLWFRATYGLRRIDGAWLITHEHTSTPFHMDGSLRAAVDLTP